MNTQNRIAIIDRCKKDRDWKGLAAFLTDGDKGMRRRAARALGEIGEVQALPVLMEATKDPDAWVRLDVIRSLGKLRAAVALDVLLASLDDDNIDIRMETLHTLGCTKDQRATSALVRALGDPHQEIRSGAAEALGRIGWSPQGMGEKILFLSAKKDWAGLLSLDGFQPGSYWEYIRDREEYVRMSAIEALARAEDARVADFVLQGMQDPSQEVRAGAIRAFMHLPSFSPGLFLRVLRERGRLR